MRDLTGVQNYTRCKRWPSSQEEQPAPRQCSDTARFHVSITQSANWGHTNPERSLAHDRHGQPGGRSMKRVVAAVVIALCCAPSGVRADERIGGAAVGALAGAVVLGPIGAVAGAAIGYTAGRGIANSWGANRTAPSRQEQAAKDPRKTAADAVPLPKPKPATVAEARACCPRHGPRGRRWARSLRHPPGPRPTTTPSRHCRTSLAANAGAFEFRAAIPGLSLGRKVWPGRSGSPRARITRSIASRAAIRRRSLSAKPSSRRCRDPAPDAPRQASS